MKITQFELSKHGEVKFTGTENECYFKLQKMQSQSADWAMKYEGWKVKPKKQTQCNQQKK